MRNTPTVARSELSNVTAFVAAHPRVFLVAVFLLVLLGSQGTVSAELDFGSTLVEPNGGHGASTGP